MGRVPSVFDLDPVIPQPTGRGQELTHNLGPATQSPDTQEVFLVESSGWRWGWGEAERELSDWLSLVPAQI